MSRNKKTILLLILGGLFCCVPFIAKGQVNSSTEIPMNLSIPTVSLINFAVADNQVITYSYSFLEPTNVEQVITPSTGDHTWLNYSSIVNQGATNYITVNISSGSLPADVTLRVLISADAGLGSGATGTPIGEIILSTYPQNIIVNIGSCYTGTGINKGHRLTYVWDNPESYNYNYNYENGEAIAVTYTITSTE